MPGDDVVDQIMRLARQGAASLGRSALDLLTEAIEQERSAINGENSRRGGGRKPRDWVATTKNWDEHGNELPGSTLFQLGLEAVIRRALKGGSLNAAYEDTIRYHVPGLKPSDRRKLADTLERTVRNPPAGVRTRRAAQRRDELLQRIRNRSSGAA